MAYAHIWQMRDPNNSSTYTGGKLYDRFGNLEFFADVSGLVDLTQTGIDVVTDVGGFSRSFFMNSAGKSSVRRFTRYSMQNVRQIKGAIPGHTIQLAAEGELRQFQITCSISYLLQWLMENAIKEVTLYGPKGTPYDPIPPAEAGEMLVLPAR